MEFAVGEVLEGRVTGITKFGAFVALEGGKSGLVHISEIANSYVSSVEDYLKIGQTVKVRVLSIGEGGKINLSIKRAEEKPSRPTPERREDKAQRARPAQTQAGKNQASDDFEDRLKKFMQESDSRIADNRMYSDRKQRSRRR